MDELKTMLPQANHLLGYAEQKQPPWLKIGLIAISALVLAGAVLVGGYSILGKVPRIKGQAVVLTVNGGQALPVFVPEIWKRAVKSSNLPVIVGLANESGKMTPYAITNRWASLEAEYFQESDFYNLYSDGPIQTEGYVDFFQIIQAIFDASSGSAHLNLDTSGMSDADGIEISGPIVANSWRSDFKLKHAEGLNSSDKDIFVDLESFPEAWPTINQAVKNISGIEIDEKPKTIGFNLSPEGLDDLMLTYLETPADTTLLRLAGSIGLSDVMPYVLPDGTTVLELKLPKQKLGQFNNQMNPDSWKSIAIKNGNIQDIQSATLPKGQGCTQGRIALKVSRVALNTVFADINQDFELHEDSGLLVACVK
ncbi:hypothetical protein HZC53_01380 [Candidatus Uhrbacteria bacterium]|nr:hypothetical protein [Candidatus Uhrbacteria bacterium]